MAYWQVFGVAESEFFGLRPRKWSEFQLWTVFGQKLAISTVLIIPLRKRLTSWPTGKFLGSMNPNFSVSHQESGQNSRNGQFFKKCSKTWMKKHVLKKSLYRGQPQDLSNGHPKFQSDWSLNEVTVLVRAKNTKNTSATCS